jgi:DNA repair exonuclease
MKIAIVSDLHIGYERFKEDAQRQASSAIEAATAMADAIIIPGDVFDKRAPPPDVIAKGIEIFRDAGRKGSLSGRVVGFIGNRKIYTDVPIVAIPGTHERTSAERENVLQLLGLAGLIVDTSEATTIIGKGGEKVAVYGLGGLSEERVKDKLKELDPKPVEGAFNIFMFHQSIYELLPFSDDFLRMDDLPTGFDLYVNGHIHNRVETTAHGKELLIPGSTVLTQLKEGEQEEKGFILFDTATGKHTFVPTGSRRFVVKRIEAEEATPESVGRLCETALESAMSGANDNPVIKLYVSGKIAGGFTITDMPIHNVVRRYSDRAYIEVDSSGLRSDEMQEDIENLRDSKIGELSIRELGESILFSRLKEVGFDSDIDVSELFNILSTQAREKAIKDAALMLSKTAQEGRQATSPAQFSSERDIPQQP